MPDDFERIDSNKITTVASQNFCSEFPKPAIAETFLERIAHHGATGCEAIFGFPVLPPFSDLDDRRFVIKRMLQALYFVLMSCAKFVETCDLGIFGGNDAVC